MVRFAQPIDNATEWRDAQIDEKVEHYRARHFDPIVGRFMSEDPIGFKSEDMNLYRYVRNAPPIAADPSGLADNLDAVEFHELLWRFAAENCLIENEGVVSGFADEIDSIFATEADVTTDFRSSVDDYIAKLRDPLRAAKAAGALDAHLGALAKKDFNVDFPGSADAFVHGAIYNQRSETQRMIIAIQDRISSSHIVEDDAIRSMFGGKDSDDYFDFSLGKGTYEDRGGMGSVSMPIQLKFARVLMDDPAAGNFSVSCELEGNLTASARYENIRSGLNPSNVYFDLSNAKGKVTFNHNLKSDALTIIGKGHAAFESDGDLDPNTFEFDYSLMGEHKVPVVAGIDPFRMVYEMRLQYLARQAPTMSMHIGLIGEIPGPLQAARGIVDHDHGNRQQRLQWDLMYKKDAETTKWGEVHLNATILAR